MRLSLFGLIKTRPALRLPRQHAGPAERRDLLRRLRPSLGRAASGFPAAPPQGYRVRVFGPKVHRGYLGRAADDYVFHFLPLPARAARATSIF